MVWFQCESCGENLKKPKLLNHFRGCSARKLSCIDCGVVFDQQSVQAHTSCVTETEKYGPKDKAQGSNGSAQKPKSLQVQKAGDVVDLSIGLSTNPPWNCSLCKVNATSYETLEGHSQGKKHHAKAKAAQAKLNSLTATEQAEAPLPNTQSNGSEFKAAAATDGIISSQTSKGEEGNNAKKRKTGLAVDEGKEKLGEKRKKSSKGEELVDAAVEEDLESCKNGGGGKSGVEDSAAGIAHNVKAIKWKKLTTKVLLKVKAPEKGIKIKELLKELLPMVTPGAADLDKKTLKKQLVEKLNASSKFEVNGKWIALAKTS